MAQQQAPAQRYVDDEPRSGLATGFIVFAGVIMIMSGAFQTMSGMVAVLANEFYVSTPNYLFELDATTWGWTHLLLGLVVIFAGAAVMSAQTWGRVVGVTLAVISAVTNFAFLPYYPFWAVLIIALDIFVIWALAAHGRDVRR